ncbi:hypothetical protein [Cupriavidus necator]
MNYAEIDRASFLAFLRESQACAEAGLYLAEACCGARALKTLNELLGGLMGEW